MESKRRLQLQSKSEPWNRGRLIGQKRPLKPKDVWAIRIRLQLQHRKRDLALFNLAIDSKLRGCDLVRLQVTDVCVGSRVRDRSTVTQQKTGRLVQFEITEQTRASIQEWLANIGARDTIRFSTARLSNRHRVPAGDITGSFGNCPFLSRVSRPGICAE